MYTCWIPRMDYNSEQLDFKPWPLSEKDKHSLGFCTLLRKCDCRRRRCNWIFLCNDLSSQHHWGGQTTSERKCKFTLNPAILDYKSSSTIIIWHQNSKTRFAQKPNNMLCWGVEWSFYLGNHPDLLPSYFPLHVCFAYNFE